MTTLLKYNSIFATPVRRTNVGASTDYKGCEEAVMAIFFFIKFNVEMIYLNGECRAIYPRLSRGHDFAGLFSTLGIKEVLKMALERPGNFIPKFWWDSLTVLSYIEMVYNSKQKNPSWNCFWVSPARMFQWSHLFEFGVTCCMLSTCHVSSRIVPNISKWTC